MSHDSPVQIVIYYSHTDHIEISFHPKVHVHIVQKSWLIIGVGPIVKPVVISFYHDHKSHKTKSLPHKLAYYSREQHLYYGSACSKEHKVEHGNLLKVIHGVPKALYEIHAKKNIGNTYYVGNIKACASSVKEIFIIMKVKMSDGICYDHELQDEKRG